MKKKIILMFAVIAFAGALAFNSITNSNKTALSAVTLSNIEALTQGEVEVGPEYCKSADDTCCWPEVGLETPNMKKYSI